MKNKIPVIIFCAALIIVHTAFTEDADRVKKLSIEGWVSPEFAVMITKTGTITKPVVTVRITQKGKERGELTNLTTYCYGRIRLAGNSSGPIGGDQQNAREAEWKIDVFTQLEAHGGNSKLFVDEKGFITMTLLWNPIVSQIGEGIPRPIACIVIPVSSDGNWNSTVTKDRVEKE